MAFSRKQLGPVLTANRGSRTRTAKKTRKGEMGGCARRIGNKAPTSSVVLTSNPPSGPKLQKSHLALLPPGRTKDRRCKSERVGCVGGPGHTGLLGGPRPRASGARSFFPSLLRVSPLRAWGLEVAWPRLPASLPTRVSSLPPAPLHSPRLGPASASHGCPASTASQPDLPLAPFPP